MEKTRTPSIKLSDSGTKKTTPTEKNIREDYAKADLGAGLGNQLIKVSNIETALKAFGKVKEQIDDAAKKVSAIQIVDSSSMQIGTAITTELNKAVNLVKKRGKELREPFKEQIAFIKAAEDYLIELASPALEAARAKIIEYQNQENEKTRLAQEALLKEKEQQEAAIAAETARKSAIQTKIFDFEAEAMGAIALAETKDQLKVIAKEYSTIPIPKEEYDYWIENFNEQIEQVLKRVSEAGNKRWFAIIELAKLKGKEAELKKQQMALDAEKAALDASKAQEAAKDELKLEAAQQAEEVAADVTGQMMDLDVKVGPATRETYFFEAVKEEDMPHYWKSMDEAKIRAWLKLEKEQGHELPKDGEVVWGVKFGIKQTPVLR